MPRVKFNAPGKWGDQGSQPPGKVLQVRTGDVRDVSQGLADYVVASGKGELFSEESKSLESGSVPKAEKATPAKKKSTTKKKSSRKWRA